MERIAGEGTCLIIPDSPPTIVSSIEREEAEFKAREELLSMEEDPTARAERHLKGEHTYKTVAILQEELKVVREANRQLEDKLKRRSTTLTKKIDRNTNWTIVCVVLVVVALVGPTDKVAAFVVWLIENYRKAGAK